MIIYGKLKDWLKVALTGNQTWDAFTKGVIANNYSLPTSFILKLNNRTFGPVTVMIVGKVKNKNLGQDQISHRKNLPGLRSKSVNL